MTVRAAEHIDASELSAERQIRLPPDVARAHAQRRARLSTLRDEAPASGTPAPTDATERHALNRRERRSVVPFNRAAKRQPLPKERSGCPAEVTTPEVTAPGVTAPGVTTPEVTTRAPATPTRRGHRWNTCQRYPATPPRHPPSPARHPATTPWTPCETHPSFAPWNRHPATAACRQPLRSHPADRTTAATDRTTATTDRTTAANRARAALLLLGQR